MIPPKPRRRRGAGLPRERRLASVDDGRPGGRRRRGPDVVVDRLRGAQRVLAVGHENPDADTLGATLAIVRIGEALGATVDPVSPTRSRRCTTSSRGSTAFAPTPTRPPTTTCSSSRTAPRWSGSAPSASATASSSIGSRGSSSTTTRPTTRSRRRTGSSLPPRRRARWSRSSRCGSASRWTWPMARLATALMAGIVMDTATFAHPNSTPRTLAVSAALLEAGAPLSDISRRLYRSKPAAQLQLFGRVLDRLETLDGGRVIASTLLDADLCGDRDATAPCGRDHRPARPGGDSRGCRPVQGGRGDDAHQCSDEAGRRRRHRADRAVRRRRSCPGLRGDDPTRDRSGPRRRARPGAPDGGRGRPLWLAPRSARASMASLSSTSRSARPPMTSSDSSADWRRRSAWDTAAPSTRSPPVSCRSSSVEATRVVEFHLADRKAYRATVCFGASSSTDDLEGELTPAVGPAPTRQAVESALPAFTGPIRQRPPIYSAIKVGGRRAYAVARAGGSVELKEREVTIDSLTLRSWDDAEPDRPIAVIDVVCSAGTYVRAHRPRSRRASRERCLPRGAAAHRRRSVHGRRRAVPRSGAQRGRRRSGRADRAASTGGCGARPLPDRRSHAAEVAAVAKGQFVQPSAGVPGPGHYRLRGPDGALVAIASRPVRAGLRRTRSSSCRGAREATAVEAGVDGRGRGCRGASAAQWSDLRGHRRLRRSASRPCLPVGSTRSGGDRGARPCVITSTIIRTRC